MEPAPFPAQYPSRMPSIEMIETTPGTTENLGVAHADPKHVTEEDSCNVQMVGPWPLKRGSSSETIVATRVGFEFGSQGDSTDEISKGKPEFSALIDAVDKQCEQIKLECDRIKIGREEAKLTSDENAEILEGTRAQLRRPGAGDIRIVATGGGRNIEEEALPESSATTGRDIEQQAGDMAHALGSCCRECNKTLQRKESSALAGAWVVGVCGVVILFSPGLLAQEFSKDGNAAIFDVQGDSEKTLHLFFGLLVIPAVAVGIVVAIAQWSLLRHNRLSGMAKPAKAHNRSRIIGVIVIICWVFLLVMGSIGPLSTYLTPMK